LLGDEVAFVDSREVVFGLPVREFPSFRKAAEEAAISRFYGGIHYMPAILNGMDQGDRVGQLMVHRIQTRSIPVIASSDGENLGIITSLFKKFLISNVILYRLRQ